MKITNITYSYQNFSSIHKNFKSIFKLEKKTTKTFQGYKSRVEMLPVLKEKKKRKKNFEQLLVHFTTKTKMQSISISRCLTHKTTKHFKPTKFD